MPQRSRAASAATGQVRIIGGAWRGRRITFDATAGLRPTPDRVRETLFNWLQPWIDGARCLDLFCGSGVLGLEALSRGAVQAVFVDSSSVAIAALRRNVELLRADGATVVQGDATAWVDQGGRGPFDILFLDPPYRTGLVARCATVLEKSGALAPGALVYVETGADETTPELPGTWVPLREKRAGQVAYRLLRRESA